MRQKRNILIVTVIIIGILVALSFSALAAEDSSIWGFSVDADQMDESGTIRAITSEIKTALSALLQESYLPVIFNQPVPTKYP